MQSDDTCISTVLIKTLNTMALWHFPGQQNYRVSQLKPGSHSHSCGERVHGINTIWFLRTVKSKTIFQPNLSTLMEGTFSLNWAPAPPLGPKKGTYSCSTFHEKRGSFWGRSAIRIFVKKGTFSRQKFAISTLIDFLWQVDSVPLNVVHIDRVATIPVIKTRK